MSSGFHKTMMDVEHKFKSLSLVGKANACSGLNWPGNGWDMTFPEAPLQCATEICENTVMLYRQCHNFWSANYAQWGQMNRLCGTSLQDALIGAWLWKNLSGKGDEYDSTLIHFVRAGWNGSGWDKVPENNKYKDCKACEVEGSRYPKYSEPFDTKGLTRHRGPMKRSSFIQIGLATTLALYYFVIAPIYPLYRAERIVQRHTPALVAEAKIIKASTPHGIYWGDYPPIMQQLKPYRIRTSERYGDGVEIMLTGGYHSGIVIVVNSQEFNTKEIPFKVEKLNDSVYAFKETGW